MPASEASSSTDDADCPGLARTLPKSWRSFILSPSVVLPALHFLSSLSNSLPGSAYKLLQIEEAKLEPGTQAVINGVVGNLPWDFKIVVALLYDCLPIRGRMWTPYLSVAIVMESVNKLLLGSLSPTVGWLCTEQFTSTLAQVFIGVAFDTLAVHCTRRERAEGRTLGSVQTDCWIALYAGTLVGGLGGSMLIDNAVVSRHAIFYLASVVKLVMLAVVLVGIADPPAHAAGAPSDGSGSSLSSVCSRASIRASGLLQSLAVWTRAPRVWKPVLFIFLWMLHPNSADAFDSFMLRKPEPLRPNVHDPQPLGFTATEYSLVGSIGTAGTIIGGIAYKNWMRHFRLTELFAGLIVVGALITSLQLVLLSTPPPFGGSKAWMVVFAAGEGLVQQAASFMLAMPILLLIASICPDGAVATSFALITSIQSAGGDLGSAISSLLTSVLGIKQSDFSHLGTLVLICCVGQLAFGLLPLFPLVPASFARSDGGGSDPDGGRSDGSGVGTEKDERAGDSEEGGGGGGGGGGKQQQQQQQTPTESTTLLGAGGGKDPASYGGMGAIDGKEASEQAEALRRKEDEEDAAAKDTSSPFGTYLLGSLFSTAVVLSILWTFVVAFTHSYTVSVSSELTVTLASRGGAPSLPLHIAIGADATVTELYAAQELEDHLRRACPGLALTRGPPKLSGGVFFAPAPAQFALGPTAALALGAVSTATLAGMRSESLLIDTVTDPYVAVLTGGSKSERGTIYAVNKFLEACGFRFLAPDETTLPSGGCPALPAVNKLANPAFSYRDNNQWALLKHPQWSTRVGMNGETSNQSDAIGGHLSYATPPGFVHTAYKLLRFPDVDVPPGPQKPPAGLVKRHPEWFWPPGVDFMEGQLCWSNASLVQFLISQCRKVMRSQPHPESVKFLSVSQMDNPNQCMFDAEMDINDAEGSPIGALLRAVNTIAGALKDEFPHLLVDTLAYQWSRRPPLITKPAPNVVVRLCSIECDFAHPLSSPLTNGDFARDLTGWARLAGARRLFVWDYVTNFKEYFVPFPNYGVLVPNARFLYKHGVVGVFEEGVYNTNGGDLSQLKNYLIARALWSADEGPHYDAHWSAAMRDADADTSEFLLGYYGEGSAPLIRRYMNEMQSVELHSSGLRMGESFDVNEPFLTQKVVLNAAAAMVEAERRAQADAKADPTRYGKYVQRVEEAGLPIMYTTIRRWHDIRSYQRDQSRAHAYPGWPYMPTLGEQFDIFKQRYARMGATKLSEDGRGIAWLEKTLGAMKNWRGLNGTDGEVLDDFDADDIDGTFSPMWPDSSWQPLSGAQAAKGPAAAAPSANADAPRRRAAAAAPETSYIWRSR